MAILSKGENHVEVRIKRHEEQTYFEEYVKTGDREAPEARRCDRYLVGEPDVRYTIEVTLKKGYVFGDCTHVRAALYLPGEKFSIAVLTIDRPSNHTNGTEGDMKGVLSCTNMSTCPIKGASFTFKALSPDEPDCDQSDVCSTHRVQPGSFGVFVFRVIGKELFSASELAAQNRELEILATQKRPWDIQAVDEETHKNHGITFGVGSFPCCEPKSSLRFRFNCRDAGVMEQLGIVKYPPPLHYYSWKLLTEPERKTVLKELQEFNKDNIHEAMEAKTGRIISKPGKGYKYNESDPKEWRSWSMMYPVERKNAFEKLQKHKKEHERGVVQRQYESNAGEIISLVADDPAGTTTPNAAISTKKRGCSASMDNVAQGSGGVDEKELAGASELSVQAERRFKNEDDDSNADIPCPFPKQAAASSDANPVVNVQKVTNLEAEGNADSISPSQFEANEYSTISADAPSQRAVEAESKVKMEAIDLDAPSPKRARVETASPRSSPKLSVSELAKKKERMERLKREIQEAERLAELRRERESLETEIEAAESLE